MSHAPTFEASFTIIGLMIFRMATKAFFCGVGARIVESHPIAELVRVASIAAVTWALGVIFLVLVPIASLSLIRVVFGLPLLRSATGRTLTTATFLWGTALIIYDSFNFFLDSEIEIGRDFTLGRRRTSQIVNRRRGSVDLLAVEVQKNWHFKCQTNCALNHCWFSFTRFPLKDGCGQFFDECGEEELLTRHCRYKPFLQRQGVSGRKWTRVDRVKGERN